MSFDTQVVLLKDNVTVSIEAIYIKEERESDNEETNNVDDKFETATDVVESYNSGSVFASLCETKLEQDPDQKTTEWVSSPDGIMPKVEEVSDPQQTADTSLSSDDASGEAPTDEELDTLRDSSTKINRIVSSMYERMAFHGLVATQKASITREKREDLKKNQDKPFKTHTIRTKKKYPCEVCKKEFKTRSNVKKHMLIHAGIKSFTCETCQKTFTQLFNLKRHELIHSEVMAYSCEICEKRFKRSTDLKRHIVTHTGDKLYACDLCDKKYTQPSNLKSHKLSHAGIKPYTCEQCKKVFATQCNLKKHLRTIHTEAGVKSFQCKECKKMFSEFFNLKRHELLHTGVRPYTCDLCDKSFTESSYLKKHKRSHTGDKPYSCEICEMKFTQVRNLKRHTNRRHRVKTS